MEQGRSLLEFDEAMRQHPHWTLVERVAASRCFRTSMRLRDFLLYVAACELRNAPEEATEQHIGIHVFQRPAGYNSAEDSIVRTHARSLRQKLTEYFQTEGLDEEFIIEIPKGHYLPVFFARPPQMLPPLPISAPISAPVPLQPPRSRAFRLWWVAALALIILLCGALAWYANRKPMISPIDRLWGPFFADNGTLIIYSNALFVGDSKNGLRYAPPSTDPHQPFDGTSVDTYTGVGELGSVYDLTRLFDKHHAVFTLKRSMLVEWDEAKQRNLVFIGSVAENPALRVLPADMDFTISSDATESRILNRHPHPGEPAAYSRPEHPLTRDYAVIALLPGLTPGHWTLVFSGLMTLGTQAAVEFAARPDGLEQILRSARRPDGSIRPFEAVLETQLGGGVPLETHLVTIHVH